MQTNPVFLLAPPRHVPEGCFPRLRPTALFTGSVRFGESLGPAATMKFVRFIMRNAALASAPKQIEHFSKFSPSPLSMKQFLDFGEYRPAPLRAEPNRTASELQRLLSGGCCVRKQGRAPHRGPGGGGPTLYIQYYICVVIYAVVQVPSTPVRRRPSSS